MITPQPTLPNQAKAPKLLDQVQDKIRLKHYSLRTEQAYVDWIKRFVLFHNKRHPAEMGATEVEAFLSYTGGGREGVGLNAESGVVCFAVLYKEVLLIDLPWLDNVVRAKRPQRLPCVLTRTEVRSVLTRMSGSYGLMANLLYGFSVDPRSGVERRHHIDEKLS